MTPDKEGPTLTRDQIAQYLAKNGYSAESLLAAYQETHDPALLQMAAERFPNEPRVQLRMVLSDLSPEQRRAWLDAFKRSDPDNALAFYLSAADLLKAGEVEPALNELKAGNALPRFAEYLSENMQSTEEMFRVAGYSPLESKARGFVNVPVPYLAEMRRFSRALTELSGQLLASGDTDMAREISLLGSAMGQQMSLGEGSKLLIGQLVGMAVERTFLEQLQAAGATDALGMPVREMLASLDEQKGVLKALAGPVETVLRSDDTFLIDRYLDRVKLLGEFEAMKWLQTQQLPGGP